MPTLLIRPRRPQRVRPVTNGRVGRLDPSRTITLRRQFMADLSRRFNNLRNAIVKLILHDDALGLRSKSVFNYDPDQPRDDHGQWTKSSGGELPAGVVTDSIDSMKSPTSYWLTPNGRVIDTGDYHYRTAEKFLSAKGMLDEENSHEKAYALMKSLGYTRCGMDDPHSMWIGKDASSTQKQAMLDLAIRKRRTLYSEGRFNIPDYSPGGVFNAFCPTGKGGGIDPTCSPGGGRAVGEWKPTMTTVEADTWIAASKIKNALYHGTGRTEKGVELDKDQLEERLKSIREEGLKVTNNPENGASMGRGVYLTTSKSRAERYGHVLETRVNVKHPWVGDTREWMKTYARISRENKKQGWNLSPDARIAKWAKDHGYDAIWQTGNVDQIVVLDPKSITVVHRGPTLNSFCPTGKGGGVDPSCSPGSKAVTKTPSLKRWFGKSKVKVRSVLGNKKPHWDMFGAIPTKFTVNAPGRWQFHSTEQKLTAFHEWLKRQIMSQIIDEHLDENAWWNRYIMDGFRRGAARAFDDTRPQVREWQDSPEAKARLDFYNGTRAEFLRSSFNWPVSREKVKLLASRTFTDLKGVTDGMAARISHTLVDGLTKGDNPRVIARELARTVDVGKVRAQTIARTEIIRTHAEGQLQAFVNIGVTHVGVMAEWLTAEDARVCPKCMPLNGMVLKVSEATGLLPRHPNCLIGSTPIRADGLVAAMSTLYTGCIFRISTASGGKVSVTSNHIFLTEFGFVPAHLVYKGLNFLDARRAYTVLGNSGNSDNRVSTVQDVFQTLAFLGDAHVARRGMGIYLHGDGQTIDSEISVVRADSILGSEKYSSLGTKGVEDQLPSIKFGHIDGGLSLRSPLTQFLEGIALAFDSSMGGFREILALLLGRLLHAKYHRLTPISRLNPNIVQSFVDGAAAAPEAFRKCLRAHPILKQLDDFSFGDLQEIASGFSVDVLAELEVDSCFGQMFGNSGLGYSQGLCNLPSGSAGVVKAGSLGMFGLPPSSERQAYPTATIGLQVETSPLESGGNGGLIDPKHFTNLGCGSAGFVKLDEVIDVKVEHVCNLPVYDVETQSSLIIAGNITQSQCRCCWTPANVGEDESDQKRGKGSIERAIDESYGDEDQSKSRWGGADKTISKVRPKSVFD